MGYWIYVSTIAELEGGKRRGLMQNYRLIVIPLSFLRRLDSLKYTSFIALVSIGYLVVLVLAHFIKGDTPLEGDRGEIRVIKWESLVASLSSFPVIVFAYTCHQNVRKRYPEYPFFMLTY